MSDSMLNVKLCDRCTSSGLPGTPCTRETLIVRAICSNCKGPWSVIFGICLNGCSNPREGAEIEIVKCPGTYCVPFPA